MLHLEDRNVELCWVILPNQPQHCKRKSPKTIKFVSRVIDSGEPAEFKTLFKRWKDVGEVTSLK